LRLCENCLSRKGAKKENIRRKEFKT
jgi:hypothetical protein